MGLFFLLSVLGFWVENRILSSAHKQVQSAWDTLLLEYQRRENLIGNFSAILLANAPKEKKLSDELQVNYGQLQIARNKVEDIKKMQSSDVAIFEKLQKSLGENLVLYMARAKKYPRVETNKTFQILSAQYLSLEARIANAKIKFREQVQIFNNKLHTMPGSLGNWILGYLVLPENFLD